MTGPIDFNEARAKRSMSERRFLLGPFTFKRRPTIPPETLSKYAAAGRDGDDTNTIQNFENALLELVERTAEYTATGEKIPTTEAWGFMRTTGDENDVVSFEDLASITQWLVSGVVERPTGQPSDSPDGTPTPTPGTSSTGISPSEEPASMTSMLAAHSTPSTPS